MLLTGPEGIYQIKNFIVLYLSMKILSGAFIRQLADRLWQAAMQSLLKIDGFT
jgi:hypothetical protein